MDPHSTTPPQREYERLLARIVTHVLEGGLSGLSVRTLARSADCEPAVLAQHFGTREELIGLVLDEIRDRLRALARERRDAPGPRLLGLWDVCTAAEHQPLVRFFFEAYGLAHPHPDRYLPFVRDAVLDWHRELVADGTDEVVATVVVATVHGALLDRLSTGDERRTDAAVRLVAASLER